MKTIQAIYENGVFHPREPVNLPSGSQVDVLMPETDEELVARLKKRFPNSIGGMSDEDAEDIMRTIEEQCERINPDMWK